VGETIGGRCEERLYPSATGRTIPVPTANSAFAEFCIPEQVPKPSVVLEIIASKVTRFVLKFVFMCLLTHMENGSDENILAQSCIRLTGLGTFADSDDFYISTGCAR